MNVGKLYTMKDEMNQLHIDISGINKLKLTGIVHLQLDHTVLLLRTCRFHSQEGYNKAVHKYNVVSDQIMSFELLKQYVNYPRFCCNH